MTLRDRLSIIAFYVVLISGVALWITAGPWLLAGTGFGVSAGLLAVAALRAWEGF